MNRQTQQTRLPATQPPARLDEAQAAELLACMKTGFPDCQWQTALDVVRHTGVVNATQLQKITNLEFVPLKRLVERWNKRCSGFPPILRKLDRSISRPGYAGRPSAIYMLDEGGAGLLRALGHDDADASSLSTDLTILHALAMSDVHLVAQACGVDITTDATLAFDGKRVLRPDHVVSISGGKKLIFEVEQAASGHTMPRIVESLGNRQDFFSRPESQSYVREVRMLVHLSRGKEFDKTLGIWRKARMSLRDQQLKFSLLAVPLLEFLDQPDWDGTGQLEWVDVFGQTSLGDSSEPQQDENIETPEKLLAYGTSSQDKAVLQALWQQFKLTAKEDESRDPEPGFFELIGLIYAASFHSSQTVFRQSAYPKTSIYLLRQYLEMHPKLYDELRKAMHYGKGTMRWNQVTIIHRMQAVINTFLRYHGWRSDGWLKVVAHTRRWEDGLGAMFDIRVVIETGRLLMEDDNDETPTNDDTA